MEMRNCENNNVCIVDSVEDTIRKPLRNCSPSVSINDLVLQRILDDPTERRVNLSNKLATEPFHLSLVPSRSLPHVRLRLTSD